MAEYRSVPDMNREFRRLINYAFRPTEEFEPLESREDVPAPETVGEPRGIYEGSELVSTGIHHWFTLRMRGENHPVAGLAAVSTPPNHRRKGFVRRLLAESLREYRERDHWFAALWPFDYSFYRKFGWGMCSERVSIACSPDALAFVDSVSTPAGGEYVDLDPDRWDDVERVYAACNDHGLAMRRTEEWWRKQVFKGRKSDPYVSGWERDGELRGYLVYDIDGDDGRTMRVSDIGYVDHEASTELLRFCRYHDSQVERVSIHDASDMMLHDRVDDPRAVEIEIQPGPMIRLVDVEQALSELSYPTDGSVVLDITDTLVEWNNSTFRLTVEDNPSCEPTTDEPDATLDVATLSQIAVGYRSVEHARQTGDCSVSSSGSGIFKELFPEETTYLRERF